MKEALYIQAVMSTMLTRCWESLKICGSGRTKRKRMLGKRWRGEDGSAIVEMALSVPIFMMLFTGTASFSIGLFKLQQISNATNVAVQQLGAQAGTIADPCATAVATVTSGLPGWTTTKFAYSLSITDSAGTAHTSTATTCSSYATYMAANEPVTLKVTYTYTWIPMFKFSALGNLSATQTSLME